MVYNQTRGATMSRKILVSAIKWTAERQDVLEKALRSALKKYGDELIILTGYTAPGIKIASMASIVGISVQMFSPDMGFEPESLNVAKEITVTSSSKGDYMRFMVESSDAVMAFDKGDPVVLTATKLGKQVWYPLGK